jgi:hypothetical protein
MKLEGKKEERKILTKINLLTLKQTQLSPSNQDVKPCAKSWEKLKFIFTFVPSLDKQPAPCKALPYPDSPTTRLN